MTHQHRMPAEWEPHAATWLAWPSNKTTWPGKLLKEVESIYLQMMRALLAHEKVNLLVPSLNVGKKIVGKLGSRAVGASRLILHPVKTVDSWIRDYGPIFVKRSSTVDDLAFTKWIFNAWGEKYADLARDNKVVDRIPALKKVKRFDIPMVLEGGSIDVNGRGTLLTTEQCLLNPDRNPKLTRKDIENRLKKYLGIKKMIWLKEGIEGDDTDGHIDSLTRFVNPTTVLTAIEPEPTDKNHGILEENLAILRREQTHDGKKLKIIELPMPGRVGLGRDDMDADRPFDSAQGRLPASYANFYIGNGAVLLPTYSHRNDKAAVRILKKTFPNRKIVPIECTALVYGLGSIHCVTQQEPA